MFFYAVLYWYVCTHRISRSAVPSLTCLFMSVSRKKSKSTTSSFHWSFSLPERPMELPIFTAGEFALLNLIESSLIVFHHFLILPENQYRDYFRLDRYIDGDPLFIDITWHLAGDPGKSQHLLSHLFYRQS